ncbi:MAG: alanine racemase [Actinomycetota bacterium]|nr:alanine racemase [Actinomycetota bacterium]
MTVDAPIWAEVDLGCIRRNAQRIKGMLQPGTRLLAVVKANAYGHGEVEAARAAIEGGADWLGVARVQEGLALRRTGIDRPILLLAEPPPGALSAAVAFDLTPTVYTERSVRELADLAAMQATRIKVHVKVDTGMHRYGVACEHAEEFLGLIGARGSVDVEGIWTHFAVAEDVTNPFTIKQCSRFMELLASMAPRDGLIRHICNSAGTITLPSAHLDMVRAGIAIYGIYPAPRLAPLVDLEPAMSVKSRVGLVKRLAAGEAISYGQRYTLSRDAYVATIPCGYADGLRRSLSNNGDVLIRGRRYGISGTITMDHFLVDVGDDSVEVGDEVVILGSQGGEWITAQEIADRIDTIPYEVVCGISARVPRYYRDSAP